MRSAAATTLVTLVALMGVAAPDASACNDLASVLATSDALDKASFGGTTVGGLSGLAQDADGHALALVDDQPGAAARFYDLRLASPPGAIDVAATAVTTLQGFTGSNFDGEGIAIERDGSLLISSETEPSIRHFSRDGALIDTLPMPDRFRPAAAGGQATANQTLEGLTLVPGTGALISAMESPLSSDPNTPEGRRRNRFLVYPPNGAGGFGAPRQVSYEAEKGQGVSEILALDDRTVLVLERTLDFSTGFAIRIFVADVGAATDVTDVAALGDPAITAAPKRLLIDLGQCPNAPLDNIEAMTLGTPLADGRQRLYLLSDDNFSGSQKTRVYDVAFRLTAPAPAPGPAPQPGPAPAPKPSVVPVVRVGSGAKLSLRSRRLTSATVTNPAAVKRTATVRLVVRGKTLGPVKLTLAAGRSGSVRITVSRALAKKLRKGTSVKVTQTATVSGQPAVKRTVTLRVS